MKIFDLEWPIESIQELSSQQLNLSHKGDELSPQHKSLFCLKMCLEHKEEEALELLPGIVEEDKKKCLGQLLVNHFYCYCLISNKMNQHKSKGKALYEKAKKYSGLEPSPNIGITLGASIIVKNEEKFLEGCLKSLKGVVDEIVVVDTGSTDRTVEIAKKYKAKIGHFEWCNDFSAARNAALELNTTHWVLIIDADEALDEKAYSYLLEGILRPHYGGYIISIMNKMQENDDVSFLVHNGMRFFQHLPEIYFEGKIHEQATPSLLAKGYMIPRLNNLVIHHYGYVQSVAVEKDKVNRSLTLLLEELEKNPTDYFQLFNIANTYYSKGDWEECIKNSEKSVQYLPNWPPFVGMLYYNWGMAHAELKEYEKALEVCKEFDLKNEGPIPMIEYVKAYTYSESGNKEKALEMLENVIDKPEVEGLDQHATLSKYIGLVLKGRILYFSGQYKECIEPFTESLRRKPNLYESLFLRGIAFSYLNQYSAALHDLLKVSKNTPYAEDAQSLIAFCYFNLGQPKEAIKFLKTTPLNQVLTEELMLGWLGEIQEIDNIEEIQYRFNQIPNPSPMLRVNYGRALMGFSLYDLAEEQFKFVLDDNPSNANAWFNLGDLYLKSNKYLEAKNCYEKGLALQEDNLDGWLNLGNCYLAFDDYVKTVNCYEEVLKRNPSHYAAIENLKVICGLQAS